MKNKYSKLYEACSKNPIIELKPNGKAVVYEPVKPKAKNGFIEKFGQGLCGKYFYKIKDIAESEE